jgi:thiamine kinase-like enzyme
LVGRAVAPRLLPDLLRLVDEREQLLNQLDGLPQVFSHLDAHRGNLFVTATPMGEQRLIAVDWSFAGVAAVGQELAPLLFTNRRVPAIYELATQSYVAGLRAVGWQGDEATVLWSSAVTTTLTYGVAMVGLFIGNLLDERQHADLAGGFGVAVEELPPRATAWVEYGLHYRDLARQLRSTN